MIAIHLAVLAPGIGNVEIAADLGEAAGNVQRTRIGRRVEQQGMLLAGSAIVLENADVIDPGLAFTSVANPPHDAVPPSKRMMSRVDSTAQNIFVGRSPTCVRPPAGVSFYVSFTIVAFLMKSGANSRPIPGPVGTGITPFLISKFGEDPQVASAPFL